MIGISLILVLTVVLVLWFAFAVARRVQREVGKHKKPGETDKSESWLGHIHSVWWMVGAGVGALEYIHKAWKTAPVGSAAKFGWGALLALIAATALFAIVKLLDRKMNRVRDGSQDMETRQSDESWAYTHGRTTNRREWR